MPTSLPYSKKCPLHNERCKLPHTKTSFWQQSKNLTTYLTGKGRRDSNIAAGNAIKVMTQN